MTRRRLVGVAPRGVPEICHRLRNEASHRAESVRSRRHVRCSDGSLSMNSKGGTDMNRRRCAVVVFSAVCGLAAASASQGPRLTSVMREKLQHAERILEAVVTSDWIRLESHSRELERLTTDPRWDGIEIPRVRAAQRGIRPGDPGSSSCRSPTGLGDGTNGVRRRHIAMRGVPSLFGETTNCALSVRACAASARRRIGWTPVGPRRHHRSAARGDG